jgi:hypothetical protein
MKILHILTLGVLTTIAIKETLYAKEVEDAAREVLAADDKCQMYLKTCVEIVQDMTAPETPERRME